MEGNYVLALDLLLGLIFAVTSYQDLRYRQIFWPLPLAGMLLFGPMNFLSHRLTVWEMGAGLLLGLLLFLLSILSRGAIGRGDALLVMLLGVALGGGPALVIFWLASAATAGWGICACLWGRRRGKGRVLRGYALPFVPILSLTGLLVEMAERLSGCF